MITSMFIVLLSDKLIIRTFRLEMRIFYEKINLLIGDVYFNNF